MRQLITATLVLAGLAGSGVAQSGHTYNVRDFGARGDGRADDTAAFRRVIQHARSQQGFASAGTAGDTIFVPKGTYRLTSRLLLRDFCGLRLEGAGPYATELQWDPASNPGSVSSPATVVPMLLLRDCEDCTLQNFSARNISGAPAPVAVQLERGAGAGLTSHHNLLRMLVIDGGTGGFERGVRVALGPGGDQDNDAHAFEHVQVRSYTDAAFSLEHRSVRDVTFHSCSFDGGGVGLAGVATNRGDCMDGSGIHCAGAFHWWGGGGGGNRGADFDLGDPSGPISISAARFEGSARFVNTTGPSGDAFTLRIESVLWRDNMLGNYPTAPWPLVEQHRICFIQFRGPVLMRGCQFGDPLISGGALVTARPGEIIWNPGSAYGEFIFESNFLVSSAPNPFVGMTGGGGMTGVYPTVQRGNLVEPEDRGANQELVPLGTHVTALATSTATPSVGLLASDRHLFTTDVGPAVTDLTDGIVGQRIHLVASGARTFQSNARLLLAQGQDFAMQVGDTLTLVQFEPGVWREVARSQQ